MSRLQPDNRKSLIMEAALKVAGEPGGFSTLTREKVAREADCSEGLVSRYYGTMPQFKRKIMRKAIELRELGIIAEGIATGNTYALSAPEELRREALETL